MAHSKKQNGVQIVLDGQIVDPSDIGADYVIGQSGQVPTPEIIDPDEIDQSLREREIFVNKQSLVKAINEKVGSSNFLDLVIKEITEEIAHLKWERRQAIKDGKNPSNYTIARIASLKSLSEVLIKKRQTFVDESLDFKSPKVQKLFQIWMEFFYNCMEKSKISKADIDIVFGQIQSDLPEWEQKMIEELKAFDA
jgi:hypothetical protein